MKMAAARPQSVFTGDVYLSDNLNHAPTLAFSRDVCVTGWTTWEMGLGRKNGYVTYDDCVIITNEVRLCLCHLCCLCLTWLAGRTENIFRNSTKIREIYQLVNFFSYFSSDCNSERSILSSYQPPNTIPPKAALARFRPAFLDDRRELQFRLASVLFHPELDGRDRRDDVWSLVLRYW